VALDLRLEGDGPRGLTTSVSVAESLLFDDLPATLGVHAPTWAWLADQAFEDPQLTVEQAAALGAEVRLLRAAWLRTRREAVAFERKVNAKDRALRERIIDGLVTTVDDPVRETFDRVIGLCDAAMQGGTGIIGLSD
jgi:hypothetical protein